MSLVSFEFWQYTRLLERAQDLELRAMELEDRVKRVTADLPGQETRELIRGFVAGREVTQGHVDNLRGLALTQGEQLETFGLSTFDLTELLQQHHRSLEALSADLRNARMPAGRDRRAAPGRPVVLVVDDYDDSRECAALVLRRAGFEVATASNGIEAVIAAHDVRPTVIVMDLAMPVLDGIEATRLIKMVEATRHAHVVAYSAAPEAAFANEHFAAVLVKPCGPDLMVATVERLAGQASA